MELALAASAERSATAPAVNAHPREIFTMLPLLLRSVPEEPMMQTKEFISGCTSLERGGFRTKDIRGVHRIPVVSGIHQVTARCLTSSRRWDGPTKGN